MKGWQSFDAQLALLRARGLVLFSIMRKQDKDKIARLYHLKQGRHLQSHLYALRHIRNVSAHHGRLWNIPISHRISVQGLLGSQWQKLPADRVFLGFCFMKHMLDAICPGSSWGERFLALLEEFPTPKNGAVSLKDMGVTVDVATLRTWALWQPKPKK